MLTASIVEYWFVYESILDIEELLGDKKDNSSLCTCRKVEVPLY